jgi:coenzyme F420-reducing hydrogenase delta subunit
MDPDRVQMYQLSSAMAGEFAAAVREMTEIVNTLGPNLLKG